MSLGDRILVSVPSPRGHENPLEHGHGNLLANGERRRIFMKPILPSWSSCTRTIADLRNPLDIDDSIPTNGSRSDLLTRNGTGRVV